MLRSSWSIHDPAQCAAELTFTTREVRPDDADDSDKLGKKKKKTDGTFRKKKKIK